MTDSQLFKYNEQFFYINLYVHDVELMYTIAVKKVLISI